MANLGDLGGIASGAVGGSARFQQRVLEALAVSAAAVYSESSFAATNASAAAGNKTLAFAAVPSWVGIGGGIVNLTTPASIATAAIISAVTATTVTLSAPVVAAQTVGSGDVISFTQHATRANFANRVTSGNFQIVPICYAVLGNATITTEANIATTDFAIPDADIQFAVNSMWNMFAGA